MVRPSPALCPEACASLWPRTCSRFGSISNAPRGTTPGRPSSEIRVGAKILPYLIAGSDLICSGFGSILKYDNSFNASLLNGEELEDYLVLQRDFEADGGLKPVGETEILDIRTRAVEALSAVLEELSLGLPTQAMKDSVVFASGSDETRSYSPRDASIISEDIAKRGITVIDVIKALAKRGFKDEAENLLNLVRLRISGDYLQTSALVRDGRVQSAINDPNEYAGPGSGYRMSGERREADRQHTRRADTFGGVAGRARPCAV